MWIKSGKSKFREYLKKAQFHEEEAYRLDVKAKEEYPAKCDLFLKAAHHSELNAKYWELASVQTDDKIEKAVAISNMHIGLSNLHKSYGDYHYYNNDVEKARSYFTEALKETQIVENAIPWNHVTPNLILEQKAHTSNLNALISGCEADSAKSKKQWEEASKLYQKTKEFWQEQRGSLSKLGNDLKEVDANLWSIECEMHICLSMVDLEKSAFQDALKHVNAAQLAAENALSTYPSWSAFRILLSNAMKLRSLVQTLPLLEEVKERATILGKYDELLVSMYSRLFEVESERYLKEKHNCTSTFSPYKPPYLEGKQIDIYAEKGMRDKTITACECKLRFNNGPLTAEEVNDFAKKMANFRQHQLGTAEKEGVTCKIHAWIITNANEAKGEAWKISKDNKIDLKHAILPKNWTRDAYWKINEIVDFEKAKKSSSTETKS